MTTSRTRPDVSFAPCQDHTLSTFSGMEELEPMGPEEIRARLGVSRQRAYILINRRDFPPPWRELAMGKVWKSTDVEAWIRANRKQVAEETEADDS
jgi:prophage regulatory protein